MVIYTLRGLSLHGPRSPSAFNAPSSEEFTTYNYWLGEFRGGGELVKDDVEDAE